MILLGTKKNKDPDRSTLFLIVSCLSFGIKGRRGEAEFGLPQSFARKERRTKDITRTARRAILVAVSSKINDDENARKRELTPRSPRSSAASEIVAVRDVGAREGSPEKNSYRETRRGTCLTPDSMRGKKL